MKYTVSDIMDSRSTKVVLCTTFEECEKLVNYYVDNYNSDDTYFKGHHYCYPKDMCIELTHQSWSYADTEYFQERNTEIIPFSDVILNAKRIRGFEFISDKNRKSPYGVAKLPTRGTSKAMAYDFYAPNNYVVEPGQIVKIWTDVKVYMQDTECLILNVRSSQGGKFMLANTQGWIDADYYNNEDNEGNIGIFLKNITDETLYIHQGDRIAQGAFFNFLVADNGNTDVTREGGFGSTNK